MEHRIPDSTMEEIAEYLRGTCNSIPQACNAFDLDDSYEDEVLDRVNDHGIELCETCGWWCELCELDEDLDCEDCREADD